MPTNKQDAAKSYTESWWDKIRAAHGRGKRVRLESEHMTLELLRAFKAGWEARDSES